MRELFEICPKIQFFNFFFVLFELEGRKFGDKRCKIVCSYVPGTIWKIPCLTLFDMGGHDGSPKCFSPLCPNA